MIPLMLSLTCVTSVASEPRLTLHLRGGEAIVEAVDEASFESGFSVTRAGNRATLHPHRLIGGLLQQTGVLVRRSDGDWRLTFTNRLRGKRRADTWMAARCMPISQGAAA